MLKNNVFYVRVGQRRTTPFSDVVSLQYQTKVQETPGRVDENASRAVANFSFFTLHYSLFT
jgi:hypothetical protein